MVAPSVMPGRAFQRVDRISQLLLHWRASDLSLVPVTGQAPTFVRTSNGLAIDRNGRLRTVVHSQPRFEMVDLDGSGRRTPVLLLHNSRKNWIKSSQDFSTDWVPTGTPTRTAAALVSGDLTLDLIGDDDAATPERYAQSIPALSFGADGAKAMYIHVGKGPTPGPNGSLLKIEDQTAGNVSRGQIIITFDGAGVPTATPSLGMVVLGAPEFVSIVKGVAIYRINVQTASLTAANIHVVTVWPTLSTASEQGNVYAGGVGLEDALFPLSYIKNAAGETNTRNGESLSFPFLATPARDLTLYWEMLRPLYVDLAGALGTQTFARISPTNPTIDVGGRSGVREFFSRVSPTGNLASVPIPSGARLAFSARFKNLRTSAQSDIDVGSGPTAFSTANPGFAAYGSAVIDFNAVAPGVDTGLLVVKVAPRLCAHNEIAGML